MKSVVVKGGLLLEGVIVYIGLYVEIEWDFRVRWIRKFVIVSLEMMDFYFIYSFVIVL